MKTTNLNIRLTPIEKKMLKIIAREKKLSMTALIVALIYNEFMLQYDQYADKFIEGEKNNADN